MNKTVIEISRDENFPFGYGRLDFEKRENAQVMEALVRWSQEHPNQIIYTHYVTHEYEKVGELGKYDFSKGSWTSSHHPVVDRCHFVCYCTIYYQDKYVLQT